MLALWPVAWLAPTSSWAGLSSLLGRIHLRLIGAKGGGLDAKLLAGMGTTPRELELGFRRHNYLELLEILREHAPWKWHPKIAVAGTEHIEHALAAGRGVVLWYCPFTHADVVFKKGMYQAGYRVNHLSALTHGFSDTRFGVAVLNPIKTSVESRYLKERCVMHPGRVGETIRALLDRLRNKELVSVTALQSGRRIGVRPLFGGSLHLAKGAPNLALSTGAALLPIFVVPTDDGYEVRIEPPLTAHSDDIERAEEECITAYLPLLERYVSRYPWLWRGWLGQRSYWAPGHEGEV